MGTFPNTATCSLDKNIESDYCMRLYAKCSNGLKPPTIVGILRVLNCWVKRQILKPRASNFEASSLNPQILKPHDAPSNWRGWPGPVPKGHDEGLHEIHRGEDAARSSRERRDGGGTRAAALIPYINLRCILLHFLR